METIAITGASGFVGQHLLATLMHNSDCHLRLLVRGEKCTNAYANNRVEVVVGDMTRQNQLYRFIRPGCIVINLGYLPSNSLEQNLLATHNLMSVCRQKKIKRLIHCSTAAVAGRAKDTTVTENTQCKPLNDYEVTKYEIEKALMNGYDKQFELVIIRPTAIYGPGVKNLMKLARELTIGNSAICYLRSSLFSRRKMNIVSIENVVNAIRYLIFLEKNIDGEVFIISDDDQPNNNFRDVEECLRKNLDIKKFPIPKIPVPAIFLSVALALIKRSNVNPSRIYSSEKLKQFGFNGNIKIEEGIALFANWYKKEIMQGKPAAR